MYDILNINTFISKIYLSLQIYTGVMYNNFLLEILN